MESLSSKKDSVSIPVQPNCWLEYDIVFPNKVIKGKVYTGSKKTYVLDIEKFYERYDYVSIIDIIKEYLGKYNQYAFIPLDNFPTRVDYVVSDLSGVVISNGTVDVVVTKTNAFSDVYHNTGCDDDFFFLYCDFSIVGKMYIIDPSGADTLIQSYDGPGILIIQNCPTLYEGDWYIEVRGRLAGKYVSERKLLVSVKKDTSCFYPKLWLLYNGFTLKEVNLSKPKYSSKADTFKYDRMNITYKNEPSYEWVAWGCKDYDALSECKGALLESEPGLWHYVTVDFSGGRDKKIEKITLKAY